MHQGVLWLIEGVAIYQIATLKEPPKWSLLGIHMKQKFNHINILISNYS